MNIEAKCRIDYKAVKALTHLSAYKKSNPKKALSVGLISVAILAVVMVAEFFILEDKPIPYSGLFSVGVLFLLNLYVYFLFPRINFKMQSKMKNAENSYLFSDSGVKIVSKSAEYSGEATIEYTVFVKAYETSKYLFLYQTGNQAYIIDKSTVTGGTVEEIRGKLLPYLDKKYKICKY